jgi:L-lactate dehydrogenase complex protein LldG
MSDARRHILERLRANRLQAAPQPHVYRKPLGWDREQRIRSFCERLRAVRGEVERLPGDAWIDWLNAALPRRGLRRVLLGTGDLAGRFAARAAPDLDLRRYARAIEPDKAALFHDVDVAITGARAGLAESGSLVLWPDVHEPRLMSLVPPVHVAVLDAACLYENFADMLAREDWTGGMPTNALLISGPSKTADIEQTLAYGIHGPSQLIVLLVDDDAPVPAQEAGA